MTGGSGPGGRTLPARRGPRRQHWTETATRGHQRALPLRARATAGLVGRGQVGTGTAKEGGCADQSAGRPGPTVSVQVLLSGFPETGPGDPRDHGKAGLGQHGPLGKGDRRADSRPAGFPLLATPQTERLQADSTHGAEWEARRGSPSWRRSHAAFLLQREACGVLTSRQGSDLGPSSGSTGPREVLRLATEWPLLSTSPKHQHKGTGFSSVHTTGTPRLLEAPWLLRSHGLRLQVECSLGERPGGSAKGSGGGEATPSTENAGDGAQGGPCSRTGGRRTGCAPLTSEIPEATMGGRGVGAHTPSSSGLAVSPRTPFPNRPWKVRAEDGDSGAD